MIVLLVVIVAVVIYFFIKSNKSNTKKVQIQNPRPNSNSQNKSVNITNKIEEEKLLYKTKGIKSFEIRGTYYTNLNESDAGDFFGYVTCEYNSHDQFAVAIYNEKKNLIGYVPKGNRRLNESLTEWHNDKLIAWGNLQYDDYNNKWYGMVYIPVGLTENQIELIQNSFKLIEINKNLISKKELTTEEYFHLLDNHRKIKLNLDVIKDKDNLFYYFPKTVIPSLSKNLEANKDWSNLVKIEEHQDLLDDLSETFRNSTLKRIHKAKENITNN